MQRFDCTFDYGLFVMQGLSEHFPKDSVTTSAKLADVAKLMSEKPSLLLLKY